MHSSCYKAYRSLGLGVAFWWFANAAASGQFPNAPQPNLKKGLVLNEAGALKGYTLFSPLQAKTTYLVDMDGMVVHTWASNYPPNSLELLPNGHLLRSGRLESPPRFRGGGMGGRVQEYTWEGELVWDFEYSSDQHLQHHDFELLPNGNVLLIAWEYKTRDEALNAGRAPELLKGPQFWPDTLVEIKPEPPNGGTIVWEWHVWDHLIQDYDSEKANYGDVAAHPELLDINADAAQPIISAEEKKRMIELGYLQPAPPGGGNPQEDDADWLHVNAVAYNPELDQIVMSSPEMCEIWIINHGTTTEEAKGHSGGRCGRGGDLLYRWGNSKNYRAGTKEEQTLFYQHDVRWIPAGHPGEGNLTVFNNGGNRPDGSYSAVLELATPVDFDGLYFLEEGMRYEPTDADWKYMAPEPKDFFSSFISGAHRLPNGNTLICSGAQGRVFEVTEEGTIVWEYVNPYLEPEVMPAPPGPPPDQAPNPDAPTAQAPAPPVALNPQAPAQRPRGPGFPNGLFRATRIPADHPALQGKDLKPIEPQPPISGPGG